MRDVDDDTLLEFVEELARTVEHGGWPRIAGRILGWLLVSEEPEQDIETLCTVLRVSKASVSSMTRFLVDRGVVERTTRPGDRRVYFRISPGVWSRLLRERLRSVDGLHALSERAVELMADEPAERRERAEEMVTFYRWWAAEVPGLFERWERFRAKSTPRGKRSK